MNKFLLTVVSLTVLLICGLSLAQDIYVYPNKRLADQGLIEYRRYTLEEARAYQQGGSFEPYLTAAWSTERQLTQNQCPYWPQVVTSGDSIFCTYYNLNNGQVYFIRCLDDGQLWPECQYLGDTSLVTFDLFPSLAYNDGKILLGFRGQSNPGEDLFYRISTDAGTTWGPFQRIFSYWQNSFTLYSSITNNGRNVYFTYVEYIHDSLYVNRSTDFGTTWNGRGTPIAYLSSTPQCMTARASDNNVHVVWVNEDGPVSVRYSRSTNNGQTWSREIDISQDSLGAQLCKVTVDGNHVVISWMGYKYSPYMFTGDIFVKQSFDGGMTWDTARTVTDLHTATLSGICAKESVFVVSWQDARFGGDNTEIFARYSTDYGNHWTDETRLSYGDNFSDSPNAFITEDRIHILWGDRRQADSGLYYIYNDIYSSIDNDDIPLEYSRFTIYPNPFNSTTIMKYPTNEGGEIGIYNLLGQQVKALRISLNGGQVVWDGTDNQNKSVPTGVYFARVKSSGTSIGAKLLLIK